MLGVLELSGRGAGFLRRREAGYLPASGDVHVAERVLRHTVSAPATRSRARPGPGARGGARRWRR